jgi:hypothetical protein
MVARHAVWLVLVVVILFPGQAASEGNHRLGGGIHYWRTVDNIDTAGFEKSGFAWLFSYQFVPSGLVKVELDVEFFPEDFGGSDGIVLAPQAFALLGGGIYGGIGIGMFVTESDLSDEPFFILRAGLDMDLFPGLRLDINANYHFSDLNDISDLDENIDTDTITLGAMVRLGL